MSALATSVARVYIYIDYRARILVYSRSMRITASSRSQDLYKTKTEGAALSLSLPYLGFTALCHKKGGENGDSGYPSFWTLAPRSSLLLSRSQRKAHWRQLYQNSALIALVVSLLSNQPASILQIPKRKSGNTRRSYKNETRASLSSGSLFTQTHTAVFRSRDIQPKQTH